MGVSAVGDYSNDDDGGGGGGGSSSGGGDSDGDGGAGGGALVTAVVTVITNVSIAIFGSFHPRRKREAARMVFIPRLCELRGLEGGE